MSESRYRVDVHLDEQAFHKLLAADILHGLTQATKSLPPKYFYDAAGSSLFRRITELPEYYLTRVELRLVQALAPRLMRDLAPREIVEVGAGYSTKVRCLLDAVDGLGPAIRFVPIDVDRSAVDDIARALTRDYPALHVHGVVGDFECHLMHVPAPAGRRLVAFFGSTIGNLDPPARQDLLVQIRRLMLPGDSFLLGVDLHKDTRLLEAAYNDPGGVTRDFNRNILNVVNRRLHADFRPDAFRHHAFYNEAASRIEMHLIAEAPQTVRLRGLGVTIHVSHGESIWTESSYKFTRRSVVAMLEEAGFTLEEWLTDADALFALVVAARLR